MKVLELGLHRNTVKLSIWYLFIATSAECDGALYIKMENVKLIC